MADIQRCARSDCLSQLNCRRSIHRPDPEMHPNGRDSYGAAGGDYEPSLGWCNSYWPLNEDVTADGAVKIRVRA